jgi:hypothetical protein
MRMLCIRSPLADVPVRVMDYPSSTPEIVQRYSLNSLTPQGAANRPTGRGMLSRARAANSHSFRIILN